MNYGSIPTNIGLAKLRNASVLGSRVDIVRVVFGDSDGVEYEPLGTETALKNQVYETAPLSIQEAGENETWVEIEAVIPHNVGGWYIREFGCYDSDGDLIFIGNLPPSSKPSGEAGIIKDMAFELVYNASSADVVSISVDPAFTIATRKYVDQVADDHLIESKSDATTKSNAALADAKTYTDTKSASTLSAAKSDATTKANAALADAKTYTDTKSASTLSAAKSDATTKANAALASAKSHSNNASNLSSGTVPDARLPSDLVRTNEDGQEFGDETAFLGNQVFFGHNKEHNLFDNDGLGNAGIKLGCNKSVMTVDGGAVEFEADIDSESNPSWSISVSEGSQSIGDTVDWSDYQLKGKSDGTLTWGGKDVLTTGDLSLTGSIHFFATQVAPSGFVKCNGAAVSRTTYAALFSKIGTSFGAGNGTTTFNVPDLRGEFIRGWDNGRGVDSGRVFGSWQADEIVSHRHSMSAGWSSDGASSSSVMTDEGDNGTRTNYTNYNGGDETRPRNIALAAYIKY